MTKEQKQLLIKDLCSRLPYGVKVCPILITSVKEYPAKKIREMNALHLNTLKCDMNNEMQRYTYKPYLFPLSGMTEEQKEYLRQNQILIAISTSGIVETTTEGFDWLNANHFDYRGLIEQGLAIDATNLNIYKEEQP